MTTTTTTTTTIDIPITSIGDLTSYAFSNDGTNSSISINTIDYISPYPYVTTGINNNDLRVNGNLVVNGRDLGERLSVIENVLGIPERDIELEKKHPKLKAMYDSYITELAKYRTWESLTK